MRQDERASLIQEAVLSVLSHHIGIHNGVTAEDIVSEIKAGGEYSLTKRRLRAIVTAFRLEGHHICADPLHGYFMAANDDELDQTCEFLHARAMKTLTQISKMKNIALPDLRGQLKLPT